MSKRHEVAAKMEPLFQKAENEGLHFYSNYRGIWFTPAELRKEQLEGKFLWGPVNWELRDPSER
jgi:hypothetical protein